jgi:hypothetical protein
MSAFLAPQRRDPEPPRVLGTTGADPNLSAFWPRQNRTPLDHPMSGGLNSGRLSYRAPNRVSVLLTAGETLDWPPHSPPQVAKAALQDGRGAAQISGNYSAGPYQSPRRRPFAPALLPAIPARPNLRIAPDCLVADTGLTGAVRRWFLNRHSFLFHS